MTRRRTAYQQGESIGEALAALVGAVFYLFYPLRALLRSVSRRRRAAQDGRGQARRSQWGRTVEKRESGDSR